MLFISFSKILCFVDIAPVLLKSTFVHRFMLCSALVHPCLQTTMLEGVFPAPACPVPHTPTFCWQYVLRMPSTVRPFCEENLLAQLHCRSLGSHSFSRRWKVTDVQDAIKWGALPTFLHFSSSSSWSVYLASIYLVKSLFSSTFLRESPGIYTLWFPTPSPNISFSLTPEHHPDRAWGPLVTILCVCWCYLTVPLFQCGTREPAIGLPLSGVCPLACAVAIVTVLVTQDVLKKDVRCLYNRWIVSCYLIIAFIPSAPFYPAGWGAYHFCYESSGSTP